MKDRMIKAHMLTKPVGLLEEGDLVVVVDGDVRDDIFVMIQSLTDGDGEVYEVLSTELVEKHPSNELAA